MYNGTPTAKRINETRISCQSTWLIRRSENAIPSTGTAKLPRALGERCECFLSNTIVETQVARYVNERRKTELLMSADSVPIMLATRAVVHNKINPM
jgi:hypothetical protein